MPWSGDTRSRAVATTLEAFSGLVCPCLRTPLRPRLADRRRLRVCARKLRLSPACARNARSLGRQIRDPQATRAACARARPRIEAVGQRVAIAEFGVASEAVLADEILLEEAFEPRAQQAGVSHVSPLPVPRDGRSVHSERRRAPADEEVPGGCCPRRSPKKVASAQAKCAPTGTSRVLWNLDSRTASTTRSRSMWPWGILGLRQAADRLNTARAAESGRWPRLLGAACRAVSIQFSKRRNLARE